MLQDRLGGKVSYASDDLDRAVEAVQFIAGIARLVSSRRGFQLEPAALVRIIEIEPGDTDRYAAFFWSRASLPAPLDLILAFIRDR